MERPGLGHYDCVVDAALSLASLKQLLLRGGRLEVDEDDGALVVSRVRTLPSRGFLRLAVPRVRARVSAASDGPRVSVRPDGIALLVVFLIAGGVAVEFTIDRATHDINYPPEFIFGIAVAYGFFLALESWRTRNAVWDALEKHP
jgi:hypothetical protein